MFPRYLLPKNQERYPDYFYGKIAGWKSLYTCTDTTIREYLKKEKTLDEKISYILSILEYSFPCNSARYI